MYNVGTMGFNKSYAFFLLITTVGAFFTIKICNAAYAAFDVTDEFPVPVHHVGSSTQASVVEKMNS